MAPRTYSERFMLTTGDGVVKTYTVQPGKRAIIRNLLCQCNDAGDGFNLFINGFYAWKFLAPAAAAQNSFETRVVLYAIDNFVVSTFGRVGAVIVSGYLFDDQAVDLEQLPAPEHGPYPPYGPDTIGAGGDWRAYDS